MRNTWRHAVRLVGLLVVSVLALQLVFVARIALMAGVDPQSTTFQRSEIWRLLAERRTLAWGQQWVGLGAISPNLQRAVVASEDGAFFEHHGVDWEAVERAWERNQRAEARARPVKRPVARAGASAQPHHPHKLVGGSTITQQLAKNLLLSGERTALRKAQELVLTLALEAMLSKPRLLEIYLNNVEWGEGLFGAQAAARFYFRVDAARLAPEPAARLAVMLPAPKRFEKVPASPYVLERAALIVARMGTVDLPR